MIGTQSLGDQSPAMNKLENRNNRQATLILMNNNVQCDELSFELELTIGRHSSCDIQINSKFMSRQHAIIKRNENEQYVLHHLSTTNPSNVNGESITSGERTLRDKDLITFADKTFLFRAPLVSIPTPSPCVKLQPQLFMKHQPTLETIDEGTSCSMEDISGKKSLDMPPPPLTKEEIQQAAAPAMASALPLSIKEAIERRRKSSGSTTPAKTVQLSPIKTAVAADKTVSSSANPRRSLPKGELVAQSSRQGLPSPLKAQIMSRLVKPLSDATNTQSVSSAASNKSKTPTKVKAVVAPAPITAVEQKKPATLNTPLKNAIQRLRKSFGDKHSAAAAPTKTPEKNVQQTSSNSNNGSRMSSALLKAIQARQRRETELEAQLQQDEQAQSLQQQTSPTRNIALEAITPRVSTQAHLLTVPKAPEEAAIAEKRHGLPPGLRDAILGRRRKSISKAQDPAASVSNINGDVDSKDRRKSLRKSLSTTITTSSKTPTKTPSKKSRKSLTKERPKALPTPIREGIQAARRLSLRQLKQQKDEEAAVEEEKEQSVVVVAEQEVIAAQDVPKSSKKRRFSNIESSPIASNQATSGTPHAPKSEDKQYAKKSTAKKMKKEHRTPVITSEDRVMFAEDCLLAATVQISALAMVHELADEHPLLNVPCAAAISTSESVDAVEEQQEQGEEDHQQKENVVIEEAQVTLADAVACILSPNHGNHTTVSEVDFMATSAPLSLPASASKMASGKKKNAEVFTPYEAANTAIVTSPTVSAVKKRLSLSSAVKASASKVHSTGAAKTAAATTVAAEDAALVMDVDEQQHVASAEEDEVVSSGTERTHSEKKMSRARQSLLQSLEKKGRSHMVQEQEGEHQDTVVDWISLLTETDMQMIQTYAQELLPRQQEMLNENSDEGSQEDEQELFALALDAYIRGMEYAHKLRLPATTVTTSAAGSAAVATGTTNNSNSSNSTSLMTLADLFKLPLDYIDASYADIDADLVELYAQEIMASAQVDESVAFGVALDSFLADPIQFRHRVGRLALPHLQPVHFLDMEEQDEEENDSDSDSSSSSDSSSDSSSSDSSSSDSENDSEDDSSSSSSSDSSSSSSSSSSDSESDCEEEAVEEEVVAVAVVTPRHQRLSSDNIQLTSHKKGKQIHQEHPRRISFTTTANTTEATNASDMMDVVDEEQQEQQVEEEDVKSVVGANSFLLSAATTPAAVPQKTPKTKDTSAKKKQVVNNDLGIFAAQVPLPPSTAKKSVAKQQNKRKSMQPAAEEEEEAGVDEADESSTTLPVSKKLRYSLATTAAMVPLPPSTAKKTKRFFNDTNNADGTVDATTITPSAGAHCLQTVAAAEAAAEAAQCPLPPSTVKTSRKSISADKNNKEVAAATADYASAAIVAAQIPLPPSTVKKAAVKDQQQTGSARKSLLKDVPKLAMTPVAYPAVSEEAAATALPPSTVKKSKTSTPHVVNDSSRRKSNNKPPASAKKEVMQKMDVEEEEEEEEEMVVVVAAAAADTSVSVSMIDIPINFKHEEAEEEQEQEDVVPQQVVVEAAVVALEEVVDVPKAPEQPAVQEPVEEEEQVKKTTRGRKSAAAASTAVKNKRASLMNNTNNSNKKKATAVSDLFVAADDAATEEDHHTNAVDSSSSSATVPVVVEPVVVVVAASTTSDITTATGGRRGRKTAAVAATEQQPSPAVVDVMPAAAEEPPKTVFLVESTTVVAAEAKAATTTTSVKKAAATAAGAAGGRKRGRAATTNEIAEEEVKKQEEKDDEPVVEEVKAVVVEVAATTAAATATAAKKRGGRTKVETPAAMAMVVEEEVVATTTTAPAIVIEEVVTATRKRGGATAAAVEVAAAPVIVERSKKGKTSTTASTAATDKKKKGTASSRKVVAEEEEEEEEEVMEEVTVILCDGCDDEFVLQDIGLKKIPTGDWFCATCVSAKAAASKTTASKTAGTKKAAAAAASKGKKEVVEEVVEEEEQPKKRAKKEALAVAAASAPRATRARK